MLCLDDFEKWAAENIEERYFYFRAGCNDETTLKDNIEAFKRYVFGDKSSVFGKY